jgi:hypothetical protein
MQTLLALPLPLKQSMFVNAGPVVVIASAPMVSAWRAQLDSQPNARIFSETDFLVALDAIIADVPAVIALDPLFAATARGAALVARVKADPRLRGSKVRTLPAEGLEPSSASPGEPDANASALEPLDKCGTRRATRYLMQADVEAKVNGTSGRLVNLSVTGSQMLAPIRLRPAECIRVTLADDSSDLRLSGTIAWVSLEIGAKSSGQRYRFGVEFSDADQQLLEDFCLRHKNDR